MFAMYHHPPQPARLGAKFEFGTVVCPVGGWGGRGVRVQACARPTTTMTRTRLRASGMPMGCTAMTVLANHLPSDHLDRMAHCLIQLRQAPFVRLVWWYMSRWSAWCGNTYQAYYQNHNHTSAICNAYCLALHGLPPPGFLCVFSEGVASP